jgi:hypothetical protein
MNERSPEDLEKMKEALSEEPEEKVDWEEPSAEQEEGEDDPDLSGVQVGLGPLGPTIVIIQPDGTPAQKVISVEECFLLAGQLTGLGSLIMGMGMQAQMAEQARVQQMMQQQGPGKEKTKSGIYVERNR